MCERAVCEQTVHEESVVPTVASRPGVFRRAVNAVRSWVTNAEAVLRRVAVGQAGQTTAEYALVIVGAAALGALLLTWATKSDAIGKLFDIVLDQVTKLAK